jgi:hypothetical protein
MLIAEFNQLAFPRLPINTRLFLFCEATRIAYSLFVEVDREFLTFLNVVVFHCGVWPLIGNHTAVAIAY